MLISIVCNKFLEHCTSALTLSAHTVRAYSGDLKIFLKFLKIDRHLNEISTSDLRDYIRYLREDQGLKESSIKRRIACTKLIFNWALKESILSCNPFERLNERIRLPKRLPRALDRYQAQMLKETISTLTCEDSFDHAASKVAIQILLETGIRVSELTGIRLDDLSLSDRRINIFGKGNRQRIVYFLSQSIYISISHYLARRNRIQSEVTNLFVSEAGRPRQAYEIRKILREITKKAGIGQCITPHMLRHTCATQWLESGLDIRFVQKLLGHHSISTTEIYTHVSDQGLRSALARTIGGKA